mmetsp:Transcript_24868/g.37793  ORF Transcript_24868/g.37793 Transcript_24868/m.37793 type:complete len:327 (-) Transcript_24868:235-1215(-)|eukprot:CAMPEP_0178915084 /NCGR_PEP_ID=MMETSP0786-20121207/11812_1 /TAXON_ID=186022 /ORGANISM="Thalassionema frauenfeldii, Strain CCMP 1798" /LENGTH=326 /DNA_ID=CAMNT_0020588119 /DNA_START=6 /DNA_END=986 /DNA_ORIENTATION=-
MNDSDDAYKILGVPRTATSSQIKSAYRKLALEHHPDRQSDEASKKKATQLFSKISNAYEILSDEKERREYDKKKQEHEQSFNNFFGGSHRHGHHFHDPFEIFAQVFGDDLGHSTRSGHTRSFLDPFFPSESFPSMRSVMARDLFADPFFDSPFQSERSDRGEGRDLFSQMRRQMETMQSQIDSNSVDRPGNTFFSSSSSSTTNFNGDKSESVTTTTRMINGKRQTVTERVTVKPDGTTERNIETTGDDDFPEQLPGWFGGGSSQAPAIEGKTEKKKALPSSSSLRRKKTNSASKEKAGSSKEMSNSASKKRFWSKKKKTQEEVIEA